VATSQLPSVDTTWDVFSRPSLVPTSKNASLSWTASESAAVGCPSSLVPYLIKLIELLFNGTEK
jgi:hypothetical protein